MFLASPSSATLFKITYNRGSVLICWNSHHVFWFVVVRFITSSYFHTYAYSIHTLTTNIIDIVLLLRWIQSVNQNKRTNEFSITPHHPCIVEICRKRQRIWWKWLAHLVRTQRIKKNLMNIVHLMREAMTISNRSVSWKFYLRLWHFWRGPGLDANDDEDEDDDDEWWMMMLVVVMHTQNYSHLTRSNSNQKSTCEILLYIE